MSLETETTVAMGSAVYGTPQTSSKETDGMEEIRVWEISRRIEGWETMRRRSM